MKIFVARQPIFDRTRAVFGYELLFRSGSDNFFTPGTDGDHASSRVIHDSIHEFGLNTLLGAGRGFVNITEKILVGDLYALLPPRRTVLEVLENVEPTREVLEACRLARRRGYVLALDDFVFADKYEGLLALADIVKIDFKITRGDERRLVVDRLKRFKLKLLAEKLETQEEFHEALDLGYSYFQGYFFCKPEMSSTDEVPVCKLSYVRLLAALNDPDSDLDRLAVIIGRDLSLSVKLLRYLNSAAIALRNPITSILQAAVLLGEKPLRRWASLVVLASMARDKPTEVFVTCMIRARFCELLGVALRFTSVDMFLIGMLSTIDVILGQPLSGILRELGVSREIAAVLLNAPKLLDSGRLPEAGCAGLIFGLVLAYEHATWGAIDQHAGDLGLDPAVLPEIYEQAVAWGNAIVTGDS